VHVHMQDPLPNCLDCCDPIVSWADAALGENDVLRGVVPVIDVPVCCHDLKSSSVQLSPAMPQSH
jgi:hypothetical protein